MAQDMSLKRNLKKILEMIGIKEAADEEQEMASRPNRVYNTSYDEERFTPAKRNANVHAAPAPASPAVRGQGRGYAPGAQGARRKAPAGVSVRRSAESEMPAGTGTMVYYMHALSECSNVIRDLIRGYSILLNLEEADTAQMQRIVDTLAGATFALGAVIRKVSERTYIIAPKNVNVMTSDRFERRY